MFLSESIRFVRKKVYFCRMKLKALVYFLLTILVYSLSSSWVQASTRGADSFYFKGESELKKSNYNVALSDFLHFIQLEESQPTPDKSKLLYAYMAAGSIHNVYSDFEPAIDFYNKGLKISKQLNNQTVEFKLINNLIGIYCDTKRLNLAEKYNEQILLLSHVDKGILLSQYLCNKGYIAKNLGDDKALVEWMERGLSWIEKHHLDNSCKVYPYQEIYQAYERQKNYGPALRYLDKYYDLAIHSNQKYLVIDCYKAYMRLYTKTGNKEKSLYYQDKYFEYSDSILNLRNFIRVKNEHQAFEKHVTGEKIENLEQISSMQRNMLVIVLIGLVLTIIVAFVIYRQRQALNKVNEALYERNRELLEADARSHRANKKKEPQSAASVDDRDSDSHNDELLDKINLVMEDEEVFCNPDFSLVALANMIDSNTLYISQVINSTYNKNFRSFINEYRVRVGMKRLMDNERYGNYSIQGIAESVGYRSASNFVLAFKKVTGMTPSLYQRMAKEKQNQIDL